LANEDGTRCIEARNKREFAEAMIIGKVGDVIKLIKSSGREIWFLVGAKCITSHQFSPKLKPRTLRKKNYSSWKWKGSRYR
jgi:hypothetical protein